MGVIPKKGDSFEYNNLKIRVEEVDHNRVMNAKIVTRPVSSEPESEDKDRTDGSGENDDKEAGS